MIITTQNLKNQNKGWRTLFFDAYQGASTGRVDEYCMRTTSTSAEEQYGWLGAVPSMREMIGDPVIRNLRSSDYKIPNKEFETTIEVKAVDLERDNFGTYDMAFPSVGIAAGQHPEELLFLAVVGGFTNKCYTGKFFFDTDHEPVPGKLKFSNKGTKKLSVANYEIALENITGRQNTEGRSMRLGKKLKLIVGPKNRALGKKIVVAEKVEGGNDNVNKGTAELDVWPELTGAYADMWFVVDVGYPIKPFINQVEKELKLLNIDDENTADFVLKHRWLWQAYRRGNCGFGLPELAYGSTGADAA